MRHSQAGGGTATGIFGEAIIHRAFTKKMSSNLIQAKSTGSDLDKLTRFGTGLGSERGGYGSGRRSPEAVSISPTTTVLDTRAKLKQRGPPESLMGIHDCPIPLTQKDDWSDPLYSSNRVIPIRIQTHIIDLKEIDTVRQEFAAVVWVQMKWREALPASTPYAQELSHKDLTALNIEDLTALNIEDLTALNIEDLTALNIGKWKPSLTFIGVNHDFKSDENVRASHTPGDPFATVFMRYNISGTFARRMELTFFPFDKQRLRIKAILWGCPEVHQGVSLSKETEMEPIGGRIIKFEEGDNQIYAEGFIQTNAFVLYPNLVLKQGLTKPLYEDKIQYTTLSINCLMERKVAFYFYNFITPIFLLGLLQMVTFLIPVDDLANRMNITVLVILTTVAFWFSMASYLPVSADLTMLDRYMLSSVFFQTMVAVQNVIAYLLATTSLTSESTATYTFNIWAGTACAATWLLIHISIPILHRISYTRQDVVIMNDDTDFFNEKELEKSPI
jgi:hypothetical protein